MAKKICTHQFFETIREVRMRPPIDQWSLTIPDRYGVRVACALCGEQRQVWQDGEITIYDKKKELWVKL